MRNFAMLYKMKESLQEFRTAYNRLDHEWQEWIAMYSNDLIEEIFIVHNILEELEFDVLNLSTGEVEKVINRRGKECITTS